MFIKKQLKKHAVKKLKSLGLVGMILLSNCSEEEIIFNKEEVTIAAKASSSVKLSYNHVTISEEEPDNPIEYINDGSLETRWSGEGESVNYDIDFREVVLVDYLRIDFHKGEERSFKFSYWQSTDGISWELKGTKNSSGIDTGYEEFDLSDINARYFRIEFKGNENDNWNSVSELEVYGAQSSLPVKTPYTTIAISAEESTNPITYINDGSLDTRWSGEGKSVNLDVEFTEEVVVDHLKIDFHKGEERAFTFAYWQSIDGVSWVYKGTKTSSGIDTGYEQFDLSGISARYFRIEFQGNNNDDWNSVSELEIYGTPAKDIVIPNKILFTPLNSPAEETSNPIENINDDVLDTRWAGEGKSVNLDIDFQEAILIDHLNIDFHKGEERSFKFSYWHSNDGVSWVLKGTKNSSGEDSGYEEFYLSDVATRYFRIEFQGNSNDDWNSVSELEIYGNQTEETLLPIKVAYTTLDVSEEEINNPITNIHDGSFETRWSGFGDNVSFDMDLGEEMKVDHLDIAFFKANERSFTFSYWQSVDGETWEFKGEHISSKSGLHTRFQQFNLTDVTTRYLRIVFQGNEFDDWNSVNEFEVYAFSADGQTNEECIATAPVGLSGAVSSNSVVLSWDKVTNIDHYNLRYRVLGSDTWLYESSLTVNTFTLVDLAFDTTYEWELNAVCADGLASVYEESTGTFIIEEEVTCTANAPTGLSSDVTLTSVVLSWDAIDNIRHYNLRYRIIGSDVWLYQKSIMDTTITLSDLLLGSEYEWQLKSECPDGVGSDYKEAASTFSTPIINTCIATPPVGLSSDVGLTSVVLSWGAINNIRHYNLRYRVLGSDVWLYQKSIMDTTATITGLLSGTMYEWQLKSECPDGIGSDYKEAASTFMTEIDTTSGGLDPDKTPAENFDLSQWKITLSSGLDYSVTKLNDNFEYDNQFYTGNDGGMVFKNYPRGAGTTTNSTYSRVELREMLRGENEDIPTQGINKNNWVFSSSSSTNKANAGGVGGKLTATLAVNRVTTTSTSDTQLGRIVIGQIHASDNEPIRLYYKKMPDETRGGIYFMHENANSEEIAVNMIGNLAKETGSGSGDYTGNSAPSNGIPLGEVFSYKIEVIGTMLYVDIYRDSGNYSASYDMSDSGYANDYMYFKAGLYSQNKTVQSSSDYEQVTFYALEQTHD